jgi:hypothetical protein
VKIDGENILLKEKVLEQKKNNKYLRLFLNICILVLLTLLVAGCQRSTEVPEPTAVDANIEENVGQIPAVEPTAEIVVQPTAASVVDTEIVAEAESASNTESDEIASEDIVTETVELIAAESETINFCLDCHINKELLIDTADPEEEVISENEGEG